MASRKITRLLVAFLLLGCIPHAQMGKIDDRADGQLRTLQAKYRGSLAKLRRLRAETLVGANVVPVRNSQQLSQFAKLCERAQNDNGQLGQAYCRKRLEQYYLLLVARRYPLADLGLIVNAGHAAPPSFEASARRLHNRAVEAHVGDAHRKLGENLRETVAKVERLRVKKKRDIIARQVLKGVAVGAAITAGVAVAMRAASQRGGGGHHHGSDALSWAPKCSSDMDCDFGHLCVKKYYSSDGACAQAVDKYGSPIFGRSPRSNYGIKVKEPGDCTYSQMCPIGFHCDYQRGVCFR